MKELMSELAAGMNEIAALVTIGWVLLALRRKKTGEAIVAALMFVGLRIAALEYILRNLK